ncbi:MAG: SDR family NAD(P)-dependent oxidoreductase [Candidatus Obscuribacterales bacterium]|nr:SDR family NAD(P)-dependent oxidoreductase [Candidatus Obscuribacterales bacterium]
MKNGRGIPEGVRVIITGASSGIGKALATQLASQYKAKLVLNARSVKLLESTVKLVEAAGGQAVGVPGDIADENLSKELVSTCIDKFGGVDILVNNAGLAKPGRIDELTTEDWKYVFGVNFFGALYATYAVLPVFMAQGHGKIVNVSSVAGKVSFPGSVCYAASKFAMTGMSEGMGAELAKKNIDVITVCPGWVRTEFFEKNNVGQRKNPTTISEKNDIEGWLMRNLLSISSEECANEVMSALAAGGSRELILTMPGVVVERLASLFPHLRYALGKRIPSER